MKKVNLEGILKDVKGAELIDKDIKKQKYPIDFMNKYLSNYFTEHSKKLISNYKCNINSLLAQKLVEKVSEKGIGVARDFEITLIPEHLLKKDNMFLLDNTPYNIQNIIEEFGNYRFTEPNNVLYAIGTFNINNRNQNYLLSKREMDQGNVYYILHSMFSNNNGSKQKDVNMNHQSSNAYSHQ